MEVNFGKFEGNFNRLDKELNACQIAVCNIKRMLTESSSDKDWQTILELKLKDYEQRHKDLTAKLEKYREMNKNELSFSENSIAFASFERQEDA